MRARWALCAVVTVLGALLIGSGVVSLMGSSTPGPRPDAGADRRFATGTVSGFDEVFADGPGAVGAVLVEFVDADAAAHTVRIELGGSSEAYTLGERVTVSYDAARPAGASLVAAPSGGSTVGRVVPLVAGILLLGVAGFALVRVGWTARVLRHNPWVIADSKLLEPAVDGGPGRKLFTTLELTGAPDEATVLAAPVTLRARRIEGLVPLAWVAGADRRFLVAAPGGGRLVRMRRVRDVGGRLRTPDRTALRSRLDGPD